MRKQNAGKVAYNALLFSQLIYAPHARWIQDMPEAAHAQAPTCKQLPLTIHYDADVFGAANGFKPLVGGGLIAVGDSNEVEGWVGGGRGTKGSKRLLREGAPAMA